MISVASNVPVASYSFSELQADRRVAITAMRIIFRVFIYLSVCKFVRIVLFNLHTGLIGEMFLLIHVHE